MHANYAGLNEPLEWPRERERERVEIRLQIAGTEVWDFCQTKLFEFQLDLKRNDHQMKWRTQRRGVARFDLAEFEIFPLYLGIFLNWPFTASSMTLQTSINTFLKQLCVKNYQSCKCLVPGIELISLLPQPLITIKPWLKVFYFYSMVSHLCYNRVSDIKTHPLY